MAIPHRIFTRFHVINLQADNQNFNVAGEWLDTHEETSYFYFANDLLPHRRKGDVLFIGYEEDGWASLAGLNAVCFVRVETYLNPPYYNNVPVTSVTFNFGSFSDSNLWNTGTASGRYYDGASVYDAYPHLVNWSATWENARRVVDVADMPCAFNVYHEAYDAFGGWTFVSLPNSYDVLEKGLLFRSATYSPSTALWGNNEGFGVEIDINSACVHYWNPIVNSFSRYTGPTAGGFELTLTGLGFMNDDNEIGEGCTAIWALNDHVQEIYVEDQAGNVVATLAHDDGIVRDYSNDSNTRITIHSFPALPAGLYCLRLHKDFWDGSAYTAEGYAGEWRCQPNGLISAGDRLWIWITDDVRPPRRPVIVSRWRWRNEDGELLRYYAPIDVRSADVFYEGMILGLSPFERGCSDRTGLPIFPDCEVELDNTTREFSRLLAAYWIKNQPVELFFAWQEEPEAFKRVVFEGVAVDYDKPGSTWRVRLRSVLAKYFEVKAPQLRCTEKEYPNIHPNHAGKEMPDVLGRAVLDEGAAMGAVEAICVNTATFRYLAARGSLARVLTVYADSVVVAPANYAVSYADGGRTYITFTADQGDKKITFDCEGYSYAGWDTAGSGSGAAGYVSNPAYIMLFVLAFFAGLPQADIDIASFDELASFYEAMSVDAEAYLVLQDARDISAVMQELLFTFGAKLWISRAGLVTIGRKDAAESAAAATFFEAIDATAEPTRIQGFDEAVNFAPVRWRFYPTANLYLNGATYSYPDSIDAFGTEIMPRSAWEFPWTGSAGLVDLRCEEELLKLGYGEQKLRLPLSVEHLFEVDILDTFQFADPYEIAVASAPEPFHDYYIERISCDFMAMTITILAVDFSWGSISSGTSS